jgi:hypothetical protein
MMHDRVEIGDEDGVYDPPFSDIVDLVRDIRSRDDDLEGQVQLAVLVTMMLARSNSISKAWVTGALENAWRLASFDENGRRLQ